MKRKLTLILAVTLLAAFAALAVKGTINSTNSDLQIHRTNSQLELKSKEVKKLETDKTQLNSELKTKKQQVEQTAAEKQRIEEEKRQLEDKYRQLEVSKAQEKQEKSRIAQAAAAVASAVRGPQAAASGACGDNSYAHAIYKQESSCRLDAINAYGCIGIGQNCPASRGGTAQLAIDCPNWRTDYDCQNAWFTRYAMAYGSWEAAYDFKFCVGSCYSTRTKIVTAKDHAWW